MFNQETFYLPLGSNFSQSLVNGFKNRRLSLLEQAQTIIFVNTERTKRQLINRFTEDAPTLLPKIYSFSDIASDPLCLAPDFSQQDALLVRLELAELVKGLISGRPNIAPDASVYELSESLQALLEEADGEQVALSDVSSIDVEDFAQQWSVTKQFLEILVSYQQSSNIITKARRTHFVLDHYEKYWRNAPPEHPVIVAGSTGSRREALRLMQMVKSLPKGAVLLPGLDPNLWHDWSLFADEHPRLDHPQGVLAKTIRCLGQEPEDLVEWETPKKQDGNGFISLAMIPAPVTDRWLQESKSIETTIDAVCKRFSLLEAADRHQEATVIACIIREVSDTEKSVALITPDRVLARMVSAHLSRWNIIPDESTGSPLKLTQEGILVRSICGVLGSRIGADTLLSLLKHPSTNLPRKDHDHHQALTDQFDLDFLRQSTSLISKSKLLKWSDDQGAHAVLWVEWILSFKDFVERQISHTIADWAKILEHSINLLVSGFHGDEHAFWTSEAAASIHTKLETLKTSEITSKISAFEFSKLISNALNEELPADPSLAHPRVFIWGTLEARVQSTDTVILGGLNEGVWPSSDKPDMWLNREMRRQLGLLPPERNIGLAAHDFQQSLFAERVIISRSMRDGDAQTTPARWLSRMTHLLEGMGANGKKALSEMRARAHRFIEFSKQLDVTKMGIPAEPRPAPILPRGKSLNQLSVTDVKTLVLNPYDIYAKRVLGLKKLRPIGAEPDQRDRGTCFHAILEAFNRSDAGWTSDDLKLDDAYERFVGLMDQVLEEHVQSSVTRSLWRASILRVLDWIIETEEERRAFAQSAGIELRGEWHVPEFDLVLRTQADRIDHSDEGYRVYDYKSGLPPSQSEIRRADKQLSLMALILTKGGFGDLPSDDIAHLSYIGLHKSQTNVEVADTDHKALEKIEEEFLKLLSHFANAGPFVARDRSSFGQSFISDYEHLSRFGEWSEADTKTEIQLEDE